MFRYWLLFALIGAGCATTPSPSSLDADRITVSGISSGAYMAGQLHVAYSDVFSGAAILAGGPYGCAEGNLMTAMARCMGNVNEPLPLDALEKAIREAAEKGQISDLENLADDRVWIFRGALDPYVAEEVGEAAKELYQRFLQEDNIRWIHDLEATHTFPTLANGPPCDQFEEPYVGACDYDGAGELLEHLYGPLEESADDQGSLKSIALDNVADTGLMQKAWAFLPETCEATPGRCRIHVVLHGCLQSVEKVEMAFIEQTDFQRWAASNDIVLLYPQIQASAVNPYGCWDWWGYSGSDYRIREGKQMKAIVELVSGLVEGTIRPGGPLAN